MNPAKKQSSTTIEFSFPNNAIKQLCLNHGEQMILTKNTVLFNETSREKTRFVYYLAEGICSISGISSNGREQIFLYQKAGELIGHVPHLMPQESMTHPYSYRRPTILAKTDCIFYKIPHTAFMECQQNSHEFSIYLNQLMAHNYSMALAHLKQMQEDSVVSSICRFLLQVSSSTADGLVVPKLFTYKEISKFLGVHEVTVSRVIGRLKQGSYLSRTPAGLLIEDNAKLEYLIQYPDTFKYK